MILSAVDFAKFLQERAKKKDGYIMASVGQDPRKLSRWYYDQYEGRQKDKALYWKENAERVWDCQGLADGYVTEKTGIKTNVRARNNYADWCRIKGEGQIPNEHKIPGAAVFIHNGRYISHVGYLVRPVTEDNPEGDWYVVEARGVMYGVVTTKLYSRPWNRWGLMTKYFDYDVIPAPEYDYGDRTLRKGMNGSDVAAYQRDLIAIGYSCGKYGADGDFGRMTKAATEAFQEDHELIIDGIAGKNTFTELSKYFDDNGELKPSENVGKIRITEGTWHVRSSPVIASNNILGYAKNGQEFELRKEVKHDGWEPINFNGENAWISRKAVSE